MDFLKKTLAIMLRMWYLIITENKEHHMKGVNKMTQNTALHMSLINRYNAVAFTQNYIWGFTFKGNVYMATTESDVMPFVTCIDKASRGYGMALRFCPNMAQKVALLPEAQVLCSEKYFNEVYSSCKYNKGEVFEKLVTEYFGQDWEKDNVPFTEDGDITVEGIAYQIKFQKATFCNEKSIANLER